MAANIEQIFQDFILNKIREIEDQHGDNGTAAEPEPPRGGDGVGEVATAPPRGGSEREGEAAGEAQQQQQQHKHKKHKKHKSKKRKKKKKRKKGAGGDEEEDDDEEESSTESGAESDGGGAKHQSGVAVPGQVNEEQDDKSKRHKGHASAKKKKKKRRKDADKSSSDSDSESESKHKEGGSSARHREALPDIIPKQDGSKKGGGGGGERDGRARRRSHSRSRSSHSRSAARKAHHRSRSRSRRRRSRTRSRSRSRHRRRSRTASRSRSSRSRSARRSRRRSRSRSPRRRRSRSKTQSPSSRRRRSPSRDRDRDRGSGSNKDRSANKSTADAVRVKEERVASSSPSVVKEERVSSPSVVKEERVSSPSSVVKEDCVSSSPSVVKEERTSPLPHPDSTAAEGLKAAGGWKPFPLLDVNSAASSSEKKGASDGSAQASDASSSKGPLPAVALSQAGERSTEELTGAGTEPPPPQSTDQRSNGSKTGREEQKDTKERAGSKRGTSSATSQSSPTRSGSREKDRSAATGSSRSRASEDPAAAGKAKSPASKKRTRASKSPVSQKKKDAKSSSSKKKKKSKSKSRSPSRSRKKRSRSRSRSPSRRKRSRTKSRSRSPSRRSRRSRSRSGSRGRRRGAYSLSQRDRWKREPSHSPVLILRKNRSPPRKKRSNSKSPSRITELDKEQLLEIAKANAAAMCAKAGMPIPDNLRPKMPHQQLMPMPLPAMAMNAALASMTAATMTAALSGMGALSSLPPLPSITNKPPPGPPQQNLAVLEEVKRKVAKQANSISIKEFTEKCKMIVDSKGELPVAKPHVSDEEDEGKPFGGSALKETKAISFSIGNMSVRPSVRSDAGMAKEFPVSSGSQHRKKEGDTPSAYGDWVPVEKTADKTKASAAAAAAAAATSAGSKSTPAVPAATTAPSSGEAAAASATAVAEPAFVAATDSVFPEPPQQPVDISQAVTERIKAQRRLAENPYDVSAICMLSRAQEQVDAWAQSNTIPGLFTGSTGAQVLSSEELSNSGPQAWLKKDQFLRAAPVSGGVGEFLMRKMGWRTGEGLGRNREGTVEPIIIDFKIDRKGLVAEGEKPLKQTGGLVVTKDLMGKHPVSALIELCNKKRIMQPDFVMVHHSGPDHRKNFLFKVTVNGVDYQPQSASPNKKHAKAMAATVALQAMGEVPADGPGLYTGPVFTAASTGPLFST